MDEQTRSHRRCGFRTTRRELFQGSWVDNAHRCEDPGTESHDDGEVYCPRHLRMVKRREAKWANQ